MTPVSSYLRAHGLEECAACASWYARTVAARVFHARRCARLLRAVAP